VIDLKMYAQTLPDSLMNMMKELNNNPEMMNEYDEDE